MAEKLLEIKNLCTSFIQEDGSELRAVDNLSYEVHEKECVAIIGESGSGKSVSALSLIRLIPYPPGVIKGGEIIFKGKNLMECSKEEMEAIRGSEISMIFQEPSTSLNPVMTIGDQIVENILLHTDLNKQQAAERAKELLEMVDIPNPDVRLKDYPFQFSGGMQQRAMIAMGMSCNPDLLICDEPTTALDVTVQAQVLEQLNKLREEYNTALIIITHNLGIVARYADTVKIMYGGRIIESGSADQIFENPQHPYTIGLIRAVPRLDLPRSHGLHTIEGEPPNMAKMPRNCCAFYNRCKYADETCKTCIPQMEEVEDGHLCRCFHKEAAQSEREEVVIH
ncbi:MAG: ABC transporter ATP-binding protein [Eubacterium sp.]|nr:ABC transporter ATP-binding protein [Eubacterium sp.]